MCRIWSSGLEQRSSIYLLFLSYLASSVLLFTLLCPPNTSASSLSIPPLYTSSLPSPLLVLMQGFVPKRQPFLSSPQMLLNPLRLLWTSSLVVNNAEWIVACNSWPMTRFHFGPSPKIPPCDTKLSLWPWMKIVADFPHRDLWTPPNPTSGMFYISLHPWQLYLSFQNSSLRLCTYSPLGCLCLSLSQT